MLIREHDIQNTLRLWLAEHGYLSFRCNVGKFQTITGKWIDTGLPNGFSDLLVLDNSGHAIFIECKTLKGKQKPDQINFQRIVESRGFRYILARSIDDLIAAGL